VQDFYDCLVDHRDAASCRATDACVWRPDLSLWNDDGESLSCYHIDVPGDAPAFEEWFSETLGSAERDTYDALWGECSTARDYYSANAYAATCLVSYTREACDAANCWWNSTPATSDRCVVDPSIRYGYMLRRGSLIMDQFHQCFSPMLTIRGRSACLGHKIIY